MQCKLYSELLWCFCDATEAAVGGAGDSTHGSLRDDLDALQVQAHERAAERVGKLFGAVRIKEEVDRAWARRAGRGGGGLT